MQPNRLGRAKIKVLIEQEEPFLKFIHLGDLHIGRTFEARPMLTDQIHVLDQVLALAKERRPDFVLIAGDIYDRSVPKEDAILVYNDFISALVLDLGIPVYAISGNHDSAGRLEGLSGLLRRSGYHICGTLKNPLEIIEIEDEWGPVNLYLMPYKDMHAARAVFDITDTRDPSETMARIVDQKSLRPGRKILAAHNYFGAKSQQPEESDSERRVIVGGEDIIDCAVLDPFDYVALGHLHKAQQVGRPQVRYAGSLLKFSASEVHHKKAVTWVEMDQAGDCQVELVPVDLLRDLKKVEAPFEDLLLGSFLENKDDFLAVVLTDPQRVDRAYARLCQLYPNIISLSYTLVEQDYELKVDREALRKADTRKLFADFFRDKNQREMNEAEQDFMEEIFRDLEVTE